MARLAGKVAIVTGAARGIGRAISERFAQEGAKVAVLVRTKAGGDAVVEKIRADGGTAMCVVCDVGDAHRIPKAVAEVVDAFGTVDVLVNNAFDASTATGSVATVDRKVIESQMNTGVLAALAFMQACYPHMESTGGSVINLGSPAAMAAIPNYLPYSISKEAIRALTRTAAREWGEKNIRVNVICPVALTDAIRAAMGDNPPVPPHAPLQRLGDPADDIAPVALFLASDDSKYMTGYTLTADGGMHIDASR
ncbi:MAG: 3-oxoacyl-ACP reductase [Porticoccaceae bacterium]|nr:3-oxoacyl-ACP reductase [Porticoccaceae bacterium]